jgi:hypothetical protein
MFLKKCYILSLLLFCISAASATPLSYYLISADTIFLSDYTKTLGGDIYGDFLEIGADAKIYGNVTASTKCFLRERVNISDTLNYFSSCTKQNGIMIGKEIHRKTEYTHSEVNGTSAGNMDKSVAIGTDEFLFPGAYRSLAVDARSTIRMQSGSYVFSSIYTEPDVKWAFDLSNGPVKIYVLDGIRFADRNSFSIIGGNPSEIEWHIAGGAIDIGTDGKFFGRFIAPNSRIRLATRSHVIGGIEARHFQAEPQSTISMEPRAEEISHSEYNFGPFWNKNLFRYLSALPINVSSIDMYVYAQNFDVKIDGGENHKVSLEKSSQKASVKITRPFMSDFPAEAFSSTYEFSFHKTQNNRIYWNPYSPCVSNCYGLSKETALRDFSQALAEAQKNGLEINMTGGVWEVPKEHSIFPVGLELVGIEKSFWELSSFFEIPTLNVGSSSIEIAGKSPRRLTGLHITGGTKGALRASTEKLELLGMAFTQNESGGNGGALHYDGKGLLRGKVLLLENNKGNKGGAAFIDGNAEIENLVCSGNSAQAEGGCLSVQGNLKLANAVLYGNKSKNGNGAFYARNTSAWNMTVVRNESDGGNALGGNSGNVYNSIFWQNIRGDIPGSWVAQYSFFPSRRNGTGNVRGNPEFKDDKKPAGTAHFFGYDAGLMLTKKSPALKGNKIEGSLEKDLLGTEWSNDICMGAYGNYNSDGEAFQYVRWAGGRLTKVKPERPLFNTLPNQHIITHVGFGGYGRVITHLVNKHDETKKIKEAIVRITLLDSAAKAYPGVKPVEIPFYRYGEKDGKFLFVTFTYPGRDYDPEKHGRMILFSKDPNDQGKHENVYVIYVKNKSDRFKYEVIKW